MRIQSLSADTHGQQGARAVAARVTVPNFLPLDRILTLQRDDRFVRTGDGREIGYLVALPGIAGGDAGNEFADSVWRSSAIWIAVLVLSAVVATIVLMRHSLRPIRNLTEAARRLHRGEAPGFANLVENSLRHATDRLRIDVSAERCEAGVRIRFADDGPGIPERDRPHIFERFYRTDESRTRATGGSGLGLTIVRGIVEAMQGRIRLLDNTKPGAAFEIVLPA